MFSMIKRKIKQKFLDINNEHYIYNRAVAEVTGRLIWIGLFLALCFFGSSFGAFRAMEYYNILFIPENVAAKIIVYVPILIVLGSLFSSAILELYFNRKNPYRSNIIQDCENTEHKQSDLTSTDHIIEHDN